MNKSITNNKDLLNSQSVEAHLNILQNVIQRMAGNSSSSKNWCITLVSAMLIVIVDKEKYSYLFLIFIPIFLFFVLDSYYLGLEKGFRESYNKFVKKLHEDAVYREDLFEIKPEGKIVCLFFSSICSTSIWPFYLTLIAMVIIARGLIL